MNFLQLVNDVCARVNETELTSANFAEARGFYSTAKNAVNSSIRMINQNEFQWPFNYVESEDILTAGTMRYETPANAKAVDFDPRCTSPYRTCSRLYVLGVPFP